MACDRIVGRSNPWAELFDTDRKKIRGGLWDYVRENKDYPYYLIRDRFAGAEARSLREVKRGEGKILALDGQQVAAYRDEKGATMSNSGFPSTTMMSASLPGSIVPRSGSPSTLRAFTRVAAMMARCGVMPMSTCALISRHSASV